MSDAPPPPPPGGTPPPPVGGNPYGGVPPQHFQPQRTNGLAITSLVTGIVGFICCGPLAIVAIVTGFIGKNQIDKDPNQKGRGLAIAGIVIGIVAIAFAIIMYFAFDGSFYINVDP